MVSERVRIERARKEIQEKIRRLCRAYIDGAIDDAEYTVQLKLLQDTVNPLVVPEVDLAINAGNFLKNLALVWN